MEPDLEGLRAHVTGGAQGIGLAIAERLAAGGARVAISDVNADGAREAAAQLGEQHVGLGCDVRDVAQVQTAIDDTVAALGGLDLLVNNAGIEIGSPVTETSEDDFERLIDINVTGVHRCTRAAVPALVESGRGSIINMASVAGLGGAPLLGAYCASKGAVVRYTEVCAVELRQVGVRVNAVCPAFVNTEMVQRLAPKVAEVVGLDFEDVVAIKQGRYGTVEEVAEVTAFLAGEDAGWTTGAHYVLDGGLMGSLL